MPRPLTERISALVSAVITAITPGTGALNLGKAEDAGHSSGDVGVMGLGVRQDTAAALAANGDYVPFVLDATNLLWARVVTPFSATATFTRPADVFQYAVGDVVINSVAGPAINTIAVARVVGGGVWINNIRLTSSNPAAAAGSFRLHVFDTTWVPSGDNTPFAPSDAERLTEVMSLDLDVAEYGANNYAYKPSAPWPKYVKCAAATQSLFWLIEARNAYVPSNQEIWTLLLQGQQD